MSDRSDLPAYEAVQSQTGTEDAGEAEKAAGNGMVQFRKRTLIIVGSVALAVVVLALALGLGLGLGLPAARDRANQAADSTTSFVPFVAATFGPAATSYRAADSAYVTTTVPLVQYSVGDNLLLSAVATSHSLLTVTRLAAEATGLVQAVPQFYSSDTQPVFVTTATYTAVAISGAGAEFGDPSTWSRAPTGSGYVHVPKKILAAVDCPASNGTQYIDPGTGAVFTKLCYQSLIEGRLTQLLKFSLATDSLDACVKQCVLDRILGSGAEPAAFCNAVSYDANVTRAGDYNCRLIVLGTGGGSGTPTLDLSRLDTVPGDWAMAVAVEQGFIPGYPGFAALASRYDLYPTEARSCYPGNLPCPDFVTSAQGMAAGRMSTTAPPTTTPTPT